MGSLRRFLPLSILCCAVAGLASAQSVSITFLNDWKEQTSHLLSQGRSLLRVVDPAADTSPDRDQVSVTVSAANTQDILTTDLVETGPGTGVFEGGVSLTSDFYADYLSDADYLVVTDGGSIPLDTATATYGSVSASATAGPSLVDLLDEEDWSPASFALGETVRVRVRDLYANLHAGRDTTVATLTSSTGDSETLTLVETGSRTAVFEASIPLVAGAPDAQDGRLQAAAGQTLSVIHEDLNPAASSSSDTAAVTAASVRFIDRSGGRPTEVYTEESDVMVRVVDLAANTDPGAFDSAAVTLYRSVDTEPLTLRETGSDTGVFEGRMRLLSGLLTAGNGYLENPSNNPPVPDPVSISYGSLSDAAQVIRSVTRLLNEAGEDAASVAPGQTLRIQVDATWFMSYGELDKARVQVRSLTTGDEETLFLLETGSATGAFERTLQPVLGAADPGDGLLQVQPGEVVEAEHFDQNNVPRSSDQVEVVRSAVRFVDEDGGPISVVLDGDLARVEVLDLLSAGQAPPAATVEAYFASDLESLSLTELGTPGLFEGSMPTTSDWSWPGDGILYTHSGNYRLTARSNGASAVAITAPSLLEILDVQGEPMATAAAGVTVRVRVRSPGLNQSPSQAETPVILVRADKTQDWEYLFVTETGPDTAVFEGTLATGPAQTAPTTNGVLLVEPYDTITASVELPPYYGRWSRAIATLSIVPVVVEILDGDGRATATCLSDETIHLQVREPAANTNPGADTITAKVETWSTSASSFDVETVSLTETGPDTGLFTGSLAATTLSFYGTPTQENSLLEVQEAVPPFREITTVTATRSGVSARAVVADSELWLTDDQDQDATSFPIGSPVKVWLRRPRGNTGPGLDTEGVTVRTRTGAEDREWLTLVETGGNTGLFTGQLPTVAAPATPGDGVLGGSPGDIVEAYKNISGYYVHSFDRGVLIDLPNNPPDAVDDPSGADEDVPVTIQVRANDTDPENDPLTIIAVTQGATGTVTINAGATVTYAPNANATTPDSFTYTISDGNGGTDTATVTISITPMNDPPVAVDDAATTDEDAPVTVTVLANDTDVENHPLTVTTATQGAKGSVTIDSGSTVTYTPNANANGNDSFTYTISDGHGGTDTATVTVFITSQNDPPVAVDDEVTTDEDQPITISVRANDTDPENDSLTITAVTQGIKGSVTINAGATVTYTPNPNEDGPDAFTYTVSDGHGGNDTATVAIEITSQNDPPVAVDDTATTDEDVPVTISVRANDTDADGDFLTVTAVTQGTKGAVTINGGTTVTYTPNANANGSDSFTYTVSDGNGGTGTAAVTVSITSQNDPPVAAADSATTNEDTPGTITVRANDTDPENDTLTITALTQGTKGAVTNNAGATVTYTPNANANGSDSFTYTISDGNGGTATATVTVTITPQNDPPTAVADTATTNEDTPATISVRANDTDPENDTLTVTAVTQGAKGAVTINAGTTVTYTPNANANGSDSFTYTISDGNGGTATATVTVTITPQNDPPVAAADTATTNEDTSVTITVRANDTDPENDTLTITAVTQGTKGAVTNNAGATVTYTPNANANGSDSFTYTISDGNGGTATATVTITITPQNDPPVAIADTAATNEDTPVTITVRANDTDPENDTLTITAVTQGTKGAVTINGGTTVTYTPNANANGSDSFTYTISDGNGGTAIASVSVAVNAVNDPPVAAPDSGSTRENVSIILSVLANDTDIEGQPLAVTSVSTPSNGSAVRLPDNTVTYTPSANFTGSATFSYTVSDGQGGTSTGQVTVLVGEALERVAVLATNSVALRTSSDVLSGDVIVNQAGAGPFLNGAELSVGGGVTTPTNYDLEGDSVTVASGAVIGSDVRYNQLTNNGTINGQQASPLALPVFSTLPPFLTATPGSTTINVGMNGTQTLAAGSYLDLIVGRKGTVTFTGGTYHFRTIQIDREAKLYFSAASEVRVQQKLSTKTLTTIGPAAGATIDASSIVFYVAGINGTNGTLAATPKAVEIGTDNVLKTNLYAPNGTLWLQDSTQATGALLGKDVDLGINVQVQLDSAFSGGQ